MREKIPQIENKGWCSPSKGSRCKIYKDVSPSRNFTSFCTKCTYEIRSENLNCGFKNVI